MVSPAIPHGSQDFDPRALMINMFNAAVEAVSPARVLPSHIPASPRGRTLVLGAGKAAAAMAATLEQNWKGSFEADRFGGLVVTRYQHEIPTNHIEVLQAGHPMPDDSSRTSAERMLQMASSLGEDDQLICLMSGGASALTTCPAPGLSMDDMKVVNKQLLESGVPIDEMNAVRKHLSNFSGGRLAAVASPAQVVNLIISDVPGDDPSVIGSGPTAADLSTFADARDIVSRYGLQMPAPVTKLLQEARNETIKPNDPRMAGVQNIVIANAQNALGAASLLAREARFATLVLGDRCEGEAREVAKFHAGIAFQHANYKDQTGGNPIAIISGGETTVTLGDKRGNGGRNAEFALSSAIAFDGHPHIWLFAGDTDGIDGTMDNAGAIVTPDTLQRALKNDMNAKKYLAVHNSYGFFKELGDLYTTGPTRTNVNDFRVALVLGS